MVGRAGKGRVGKGWEGMGWEGMGGVALAGEVRVVGGLQRGSVVLVVSAYRCWVGAGLLDLLDGRLYLVRRLR